MSFAVFTNILTIIFCIAVLVQSVRMMRSLKGVKSNQLTELVAALDKSTGLARGVLSELKQELSTEGIANIQALSEGKEIRDELNLLIGIANAMAERLVDAAAPEKEKPAAKAKAAPKTARKPASKSTPKSTGAKTTKPTAAKTTKADAAKKAPTKAATAKTATTRKPSAKKAATTAKSTTTKAKTTRKTPAKAASTKTASSKSASNNVVKMPKAKAKAPRKAANADRALKGAAA